MNIFSGIWMPKEFYPVRLIINIFDNDNFFILGENYSGIAREWGKIKFEEVHRFPHQEIYVSNVSFHREGHDGANIMVSQNFNGQWIYNKDDLKNNKNYAEIRTDNVILTYCLRIW
jgi:hypothetical protein